MNEKAIAIVNARIARALIRMEAMRASNLYYPDRQPYDQYEFLAIINEEGIGENSVLTALEAKP